MKKANLNNRKNEQTMGLTTLSNNELRTVFGGTVYFVQTVANGKITWSLIKTQPK